MNLKNPQLHKKSQTSYLSHMLDNKLSKIREKTNYNFNDSKLTDEQHIQLKTDYSDSNSCSQCQQFQLINNELKEQLNECQKQVDILRIERDVIQKKEENTIKILIQEIEKSKLEQQRQSSELQKSFIQFANDNFKQSLTFEKMEENHQLQCKLQEYKEQNEKYATLLHSQYDFSIKINIHFAKLSNSINTLIRLVQKYTSILSHIQMQSSPKLDLLLNTHEEQHQQEQQQLIFSDLHDMTHKIQKIQLSSIEDVQKNIECLIALVNDYLMQAQRIAINDMSRTIM